MTIPTTRILLIEDNPGDARLMREALAETPDLPFELVHCETGAQGIDFLAKNSVDVVVCDLGLLSLSVGIVAPQPDCADLDRLLSEADALMYRQKQHRKASRDPIR